MIAYIDTHVAIWLAEGRIDRLSKAALDAVNEYDLRISPVVNLELGMLFQIGRILRPPAAILRQLRTQLDVELCDHSFVDIAETALTELWTREPFDRLIVAHARANKYALLISTDENIRKNYSKAIW